MSINNPETFPAPLIFALVVDGEVAELLNCNDKLAAVLQSNPVIIDVTNRNIITEGPHEGWTWDGEEFHNPRDTAPVTGLDLP